MSDNIAKLLFRVFREYDIPVTCDTIERSLNTHPDYPSIRSISDAMDDWKIKHVVMKLTLEKLRTLNVPVITFLKNGEYIWITKISDSNVSFQTSSGKKRNKNNDLFEQEWSGISLAIEDVDDAGESNYREKHNKEIRENFFNYLIAGAFFVLLIILAFFSWINDGSSTILSKLLLFLTNTIGCYTSYILIRQEKDQSDALSSKFCKAGRHIDCKQVTTSKYSSFFGLISWAELGAAYFTSTLLWVVIAPLSSGWLSPLWLFSLVVLPFTLWSLFTQAFIIRKWCLFCCSIVFLLWINIVILFIFYNRPATVSILDAVAMALLFIFCLIVVIKVSESIGSKDRLYAQQRETAKIKYSIETIQAQLSEPIYTIDNIGFVWNNSDALHDISLYISTSCQHCEKAVKELRKLTEIYPNFRYQLIFAVSSDNMDAASNVIIRHLIRLYHTKDKDSFFDILDSWYEMSDKHPEALQKAFPITSDQDNKEEIDILFKFHQQAKISYTPAILLNGRLLSQLYSYSDMFGIVKTLNAEKE